MKKLICNWKTISLCAIAVLGLTWGVPKAVTVSNTVNGRELPIYSVETPDKKVALSFDAAWGSGHSSCKLSFKIDFHIRSKSYILF